MVKRLFLVLSIICTVLMMNGAQAAAEDTVVELVPAELSPPPMVISTDDSAPAEAEPTDTLPTDTTEQDKAPNPAPSGDVPESEPAIAAPLAGEATVPDKTVVAPQAAFSAGTTGPGWKELDFSKALISLAGPSSLFIRDVLWNGKSWAILAKTDDNKTWKLAETWEMSEGTALPARALFDLATLTLKDGNTLVLDGVMVDGEAVRTTLTIQEDGTLAIAPGFEVGSVVGASLSRSSVLGRPANAAEAIGNERLRTEDLARIGNLESELKTARTELAELAERNKVLQAEVETLRTELARLQALELEAAMSGKAPEAETKGLGDLQKRLATLESRVVALESGIGQADTGSAGKLMARVEELSVENNRLTAERQAIESSLRMAFVKSGYIATMRPLFTQVIHKGFGGGVKEIGSWVLSGTTLSQTDPRQHFSRFTLPLEQKGQALLYKFTMQSTGKDWVGAGLHFFGSKSPKRGYGHGESLLVWLTRSEPHEHNRGKGTWLQVYKSSTDVIMDRVLDASIEESMAREMIVEVLYQPAEEYVTIAVNGIEKIRYKTWFGLYQGLELAFRTLDTAQFKDFEVRAMGGGVVAPSGK